MPRCPACSRNLGPDDFSEILEAFTCPECGLQMDEEEPRDDKPDGSEV